MEERKLELTPEINEEIGKLAIDVAMLGEDKVNDLSQMSLRLMRNGILVLENDLLNIEAQRESDELIQASYEIQEVVRRARAIL